MGRLAGRAAIITGGEGSIGMAATATFGGMIPLGRHAALGEIARVVLFLDGDDSSFMTGTTLAVDGAMSS